MYQNQYALKLLLGKQWGQKALNVKVIGKSQERKVVVDKNYDVNSWKFVKY